MDVSLSLQSISKQYFFKKEKKLLFLPSSLRVTLAKQFLRDYRYGVAAQLSHVHLLSSLALFGHIWYKDERQRGTYLPFICSSHSSAVHQRPMILLTSPCSPLSPPPPPHPIPGSYLQGLYSQVPQTAAPLERLNARVAVTVTGQGRAELECFQSFSLKEVALLDLSDGSLEDMLIWLYLT